MYNVYDYNFKKVFNTSLCILTLIASIPSIAIAMDIQADDQTPKRRNSTQTILIKERNITKELEGNNIISPRDSRQEDEAQKDLAKAPQGKRMLPIKDQVLMAAKNAARGVASSFFSNEQEIQDCISPLFNHRRVKTPNKEHNKAARLGRVRHEALNAAINAAKNTAIRLLGNEQKANNLMLSLKLNKYEMSNPEDHRKVSIDREKNNLKTLNDVRKEESEVNFNRRQPSKMQQVVKVAKTAGSTVSFVLKLVHFIFSNIRS